MTSNAVGRPLGVAALALVAASCTDSGDISFDSEGVAELGPARSDPEALSWGGEQRLEASDAAEYDQLGYAVSLGADRAVLGAYGDDSYRGAAYVFERGGSSFTEEQKLVATDRTEDDYLGFAVSLGGDRVLVGAPGDDASRGSALVFVESGFFVEEQKLVATEGAEGDQLGWSVSLGPDRALVGAYGSDGGRGAAYVFVQNGGSWSEEQKLVASDGVLGDQLGYSVSLGAERVVVGAPLNDGARGAAYVFVRSGGTWNEEQKLVAGDATESQLFGVAVSLAGDRALVGAYFDDERRGAAYVFVRSGSAWTEEQKLVASDASTGHRFGNAVSLGADRALIGAYGSAAARGAAYVFVRSDGSFVEEARLVASDGIDNDLLGWSVSLADDRALVGAHYDDNLRGAGYLFSPGPVNGDPCSAGSDCASGFCADGVCCHAACGGPCEACTAEIKGNGADGACGPVRAGTDPEGDCSDDGAATCEGNGHCDGSGACQRYPTSTGCEPEPCSDGDECTSGWCEDDICCDRACASSETCQAELKVSGGDGTCGPSREDGTCDAAAAGNDCARAPAQNPDDDTGCACRAGGSRRPGRGSFVGVPLALLFVRRRRVRKLATASSR